MSEAKVTTRSDEQLSCLMIHLDSHNLLLPNVSVAEVIHFLPPVAVEETANWFLGQIEWRGLKVPLVSYENIIDESKEQALFNRNTRIAICNNVTGQDNLPFFAMVIQGIPRLLKVKTEDLKIDEQAQLSRVEEMAVSTTLGRATIPDIEYLETLIIRELQR